MKGVLLCSNYQMGQVPSLDLQVYVVKVLQVLLTYSQMRESLSVPNSPLAPTLLSSPTSFPPPALLPLSPFGLPRVLGGEMVLIKTFFCL